jgi:ribonucleoside-diphosphate reductase alpha chain
LQSDFSKNIMDLRYAWIIGEQKETWEQISKRVVNAVFTSAPYYFPRHKELKKEVYEIIASRKFIPGGRFLAQAGRKMHQTQNCFLLRAEDTREGWGSLMEKSARMLMSGGGIGVDYSDIRAKGSPLKRSGGESSGPLPLMRTVNEIGRGVMAGGNRRSAIWAGLHWNHSDTTDFVEMKNWSHNVRKVKETEFDFAAPMDMTNISVILDKDFFDAYNNPDNTRHDYAVTLYQRVVQQMVSTGEPGFSVDYANKKESLRNACCESVSEDDSDVCCLGSINLANIKSKEELQQVTNLAILFLLLGTLYSDVPHPAVAKVREKNRRLGLGLLGMHEWMIVRKYKYEPNEELAEWLKIWKDESDKSKVEWAELLGVNIPVATRAIAPNGSIAIAGGMTTGGIEPIFSLAYKRRYLTPDGWKMQYVVDAVAEKLIEQGFDLSGVEDAYSLSYDIEKRIAFQAFVQGFVDNAISSTLNIPAHGTPGNDNPEEFGKILMKHLPSLRGITAYPDGARGGQPLTATPIEYALKHTGVIFETKEECVGGICGL